MTALILGIVVVLIVFYFISTQRELVKLDENCNNALSQIEVQLQSRWEELTNVAESVAQYDEHESRTMIETIRARQGATKTAGDVNAQEDFMGQIMSRIMAVAEAYPQLQSAVNYQQLIAHVKEYNENVRISRMVYNDTATKINRYVRQFPSSIVASMLHFDLREYLKVDKEEMRSAPVLFPKKQAQQ